MPDTLSTLGVLSSTQATGSKVPRLVLLLNADRPRTASRAWDLDTLDTVDLGRGETAGAERHEKDATHRLLVTIADPRASVQHARLTRVANRWVLEDRGSKNGSHVNGKRETRVVLEHGDLVEIGHTFFLFTLETKVAAPAAEHPGLATLCNELLERFDALARVAPHDLSVIVHGESGTGKELAARAVHDLSGRRGRFVAVSCAALPDEIMESELFGFQRGAFSGALESRPGLVRAADGGTLFLDEIGDLPSQAQGVLLRVLQEKEVLPIGTTQPVKLDLRVVAATHRDLDTMATNGTFRSDLLARLRGHVVILPPLRERRQDLGLLITSLLDRIGAPPELRFSPDAARALLCHPYPLNVRELEQTLRSAIALAKDSEVGMTTLPFGMPSSSSSPGTAAEDAVLDPEDAELRARLVELLREHAGNLSAVARDLRKDRTQIRRWLTRFGIDPEGFR